LQLLTLSIASYVIFSILFMLAHWLTGTTDNITPSSAAPPPASTSASMNHPTPSSATPPDSAH
ncbi:MAG: hypothetical protein ABI831_17540, partial [Betaproteobacteria bacterium]